MKHCPLISFAVCLALLSGCKKANEATETDTSKQKQEDINKIIKEVREEGSAEFIKADTPILPVSKGDTWTYTVTLQLPKDAQFKDSPLVSQSFERKRTFMGKVKPSGDRPETDCFEIEAPGSPIEREFVEITEEHVKMRGSEYVGNKDTLPLWLEPSVLLVRAGVLAGESLPPIQIKDPRTGVEVTRFIQVVGREKVVAAGRDFSAIRILMSGKDGKDSPIQMRRTIWFAPQYGIVKEEKTRYLDDTLLMKETIELKSLQLQNDPQAIKNP